MSDADAKGRLVEQVVALLHENSEFLVETRKRLPCLHSARGRTSEIDVLLTASVSGYPMRVAFECKNVSKPVDRPTIDTFIGKLADVGVPTSSSCVVSASGFSAAAMERARDVGMQTLECVGLSADRLAAAVHAVMHTIVFLLPEIESYAEIFAEPDGAPPKAPRGMLILEMPDTALHGLDTVYELMWHAWTIGVLPRDIGSHSVFMPLPPNYVVYSGSDARIRALLINVQVRALVLDLPGQGQVVGLIDAAQRTPQRMRVDTTVPKMSGRSDLVRIETEEGLRTHMGKVPISVQVRIPVPRLMSHIGFYPPTPKTAEYVQSQAAAGLPLGIPPLDKLDLDEAWAPLPRNWPSRLGGEP